MTGSDPLTTTLVIDADVSAAEQAFKSLQGVGNQFARAIGTAFDGAILRGKSLGDVFRNLAMQLASMVLKSTTNQVFGSLFNGLLGGKGLAFAKGGALQHGLPVPFAQGGVINVPVTFPMAGGRMGLAGERGPEAIMPLARGPDGRLGVMAAGRGGINVNFNVTSPDAESFRRSETQVAAMLARAVSLGQRNL